MAVDTVTAVQAVGSSGSSGRLTGLMPGAQPERFGSHAARVDLSKQDLPTSGAANAGGAYLRAPLSPAANPALAPMHLGSLDHAIRDGFRQGFVIPQSEKLHNKITAMNQPGSNISSGELMADTMILSARTSLATVFAKAATKLAEALNSVVTKQG